MVELDSEFQNNYGGPMVELESGVQNSHVGPRASLLSVLCFPRGSLWFASGCPLVFESAGPSEARCSEDVRKDWARVG